MTHSLVAMDINMQTCWGWEIWGPRCSGASAACRTEKWGRTCWVWRPLDSCDQTLFQEQNLNIPLIICQAYLNLVNPFLRRSSQISQPTPPFPLSPSLLSHLFLPPSLHPSSLHPFNPHHLIPGSVPSSSTQLGAEYCRDATPTLSLLPPD